MNTGVKFPHFPAFAQEKMKMNIGDKVRVCIDGEYRGNAVIKAFSFQGLVLVEFPETGRMMVHESSLDKIKKEKKNNER